MNIDEFSEEFSDIFGDDQGQQDVQNQMNVDPLQQQGAKAPQIDNSDLFGSQQDDSQQNAQNALDALRNQANPTNVVEMALMKRGFNPRAIRIDEGNGKISTVDFESLPQEDQYSLLFEQEKNPADDLDEDEIHLLNSVRSSGMSVKDYLKAVIESAGSNRPQYQSKQSVNNLDDDTLFLADLKLKYGEGLTQDEMIEKLTQAKNNPQLFEKTMGILRKSYEDQEKQELDAYNKYQEEQEKQQYAELNYRMDMTMNNPKFIDLGNSAIQLSEQDKNDIKAFVFSKAADGNTYLHNALRNPDVLTKVAWFITKGNDFMRELVDHYDKQMENISKTSYQKGFEKAGGRNTIRKPSVSVTGKPKPPAGKKYLSVDDLY